ncbi:MAG: NUDIX domain-containing protein [Spirochaetes bacterium]|nr:NUDIX domain-containing protein [Spirochaetota bacterium]
MNEKRKIRVRVGAVIINDRRVLLIEHIKDGKKYWLVPGGGVKFGENLKEALERELKEELSIKITVNDLLFSSDSISKNENRHIINLYFSCQHEFGNLQLGDDERLNNFGYFSADELAKMTIIPQIKNELLLILEKGNDSIKRYSGSGWDEI